MLETTEKRPKERPLDYYLPPSYPDQSQRSSFPQWHPPGAPLSIGQAPAKFLCAADMYRQDSTTYGYTPPQQHHQPANVRVQTPRPGRPLASPPTPQPSQPPTSTMVDPNSLEVHRTNGQVDIRRPTRSPLPPLPALPTTTSLPPRQDFHVHPDSKRPFPSEHTNGAANGRPTPAERPSTAPPRTRTISQPNRGHQPPQNSPPLSQPAPWRPTDHPDQNDPFTCTGLRNPLRPTRTRLNTTENPQRGSTHACVSL
jgi:hypothetical protein